MNHQLARQYYQRAQSLVDAGKFDEAMPLLGMLHEAYHDDKNLLVLHARAVAGLQKHDEALAICDDLIERFDSRRAKDLKANLLESLVDRPQSFKSAYKKDTSRPRWAIRLIAALIGTGLLGAAAGYAYRISSPSVKLAAPTDDEFEAIVEQRKQAAVDRAMAPVDTPGQTHPREEWQLTATNGVPTWKPGIYRRVPCLNAPERTLDVYIPMAYQERPTDLFPCVVVQMASPNQGFIGLESWAESREVILVVVNSSHNGTFENNYIAQDHALETIANTMRVDQRLGFAIGMSGGARSSWRMVCRYPENFQGIVMMGMGGLSDGKLPRHVRVGYIHGESDFNNRSIRRAVSVLPKRGHEIREKIVPGGHIRGPVEERVAMLDWMVEAARRDRGLPHPRR